MIQSFVQVCGDHTGIITRLVPTLGVLHVIWTWLDEFPVAWNLRSNEVQVHSARCHHVAFVVDTVQPLQRRTGRTQLIDLLLHTQHIDSDEAIVPKTMLATEIGQLPQCVIDGGGGVRVHRKRFLRAKIVWVFRATPAAVGEPFEPVFDHTFPVFRRRLHLANSSHTFLHLFLTTLRHPSEDPSMPSRHALF